jgi:hypothetical protein
MNPQFYNQNITGAGANTWHGGFLWNRPVNQPNTGGFLGHPFVSPTNLETAQSPAYIDRIRQTNLPATENKRSGLLTGSSDLGGLIGDNKMAAALIALRGLQAGSRGQNIFQAAPDAVMGGLADSSLIEKYKDIRKKSKAKDKIQKSKLFTEREKLMVEAGMKLPTSKATAKMKDFSFFKKIDWNNPIEVAAANAIYTGESKTKWMGKISASLAKREDLSDDEIKEKLTFFETIYDDTVGKTDNVSQKADSKKVITDEVVNNYRIQYESQGLGTITNEKIIEDLIKNYGYSK